MFHMKEGFTVYFSCDSHRLMQRVLLVKYIHVQFVRLFCPMKMSGTLLTQSMP